MYPFTQKYYKIYQIKTWSCRYSHSLHFLLRPIFPSCLAFACPRVAAWLTDWLTDWGKGRKFKFLDSIRKPAGVLVASPRGQLVLRPILRKNTTAATQPLGYVKVVTFKTFWKGEFHLAFLPLAVTTFGGGEGEEESEAETCHAAEINWDIIIVAKKEVWENKQTNMKLFATFGATWRFSSSGEMCQSWKYGS